MKIIHAACWYYPDTVGGIEVYLTALSHLMRAQGHEVFVAAAHAKNSRERLYVYEGIPVYRYPIPLRPSRKESQGLAALRGTEYFHKWMRQLRPDIVHFHDINIGLGINQIMAAKATGAKVVFTSHLGIIGNLCRRGSLMYMGKYACRGPENSAKCAGCILENKGLPEYLAVRIAKIPPAVSKAALFFPLGAGTLLGMRYLMDINRRTFAELFSLADKFVVVTKKAYDIILANGFSPDKLAVNRLGIKQERIEFKPSPQESPTKKPVKFGYLGRFEPIKGIYDLAYAAASLPRNVDFLLEFRGPVLTPQEKNALSRLKEIAGHDPRISFAPSVAHAEVFNVLKNYDVLCCPSLSFEGGPTVALESYAVGTPVIGSDIGGLAEMIQDNINGKLFVPAEKNSLAGIIGKVSSSPEETVDYWRKNIHPVRTMQQVAEDYLKIYESR